MRTENLEANGTNYLVKVYYENRFDTSASFGRNAINIRIPLSLSREEQFRALVEMKMWAKNKILKTPQKFKAEPQKEHHTGDLLKVGSEEYTLKIDFRDKGSSSAKIVDNLVCLSISANLSKEQQSKHVSTLLSRCIASKRLPKLQEKVLELNQKHFSQKTGKIFFKHNKSNWGSCSEKGNINISTRLLFAPDDILEYVCIHELAHLIEPNHGDKFWAKVANAMPNYKEKKEWLKQNGNQCVF